MRRWIKWIPAVLVAAAAGLLLAYLIPAGDDEPTGPAPTLVGTSFIPPPGVSDGETFTATVDGVTMESVSRDGSGECRAILTTPNPP